MPYKNFVLNNKYINIAKLSDSYKYYNTFKAIFKYIDTVYNDLVDNEYKQKIIDLFSHVSTQVKNMFVNHIVNAVIDILITVFMVSNVSSTATKIQYSRVIENTIKKYDKLSKTLEIKHIDLMIFLILVCIKYENIWKITSQTMNLNLDKIMENTIPDTSLLQDLYTIFKLMNEENNFNICINLDIETSYDKIIVIESLNDSDNAMNNYCVNCKQCTACYCCYNCKNCDMCRYCVNSINCNMSTNVINSVYINNSTCVLNSVILKYCNYVNMSCNCSRCNNIVNCFNVRDSNNYANLMNAKHVNNNSVIVNYYKSTDIPTTQIQRNLVDYNTINTRIFKTVPELIDGVALGVDSQNPEVPLSATKCAIYNVEELVEIRDYYFFKQNQTLFKHYYIDYPFIDYYNTKSVPGLLSPVDYYELFKH